MGGGVEVAHLGGLSLARVLGVVQHLAVRPLHSGLVAVNPEGRARLAMAVAGREAADWARGTVRDVATPMLPGERIRQWRRLRAMALTGLDRAVLVELLEGSTWDQVADALGLPVGETRRRYEETFALWCEELPPTAMDATIFGDFTTGLRQDPDPEGTARALDSWAARHAEPWEAVEEPVTRSLRGL